MPIPPTGWGAVEILIWDQKLALEELGHEVQIVNVASGVEILKQINSFRPDFVHVQYDDFVELCPYIQYPNAITSHFGYLEQPRKWDYYGPRVAQKFANIKPNMNENKADNDEIPDLSDVKPSNDTNASDRLDFSSYVVYYFFTKNTFYMCPYLECF